MDRVLLVCDDIQYAGHVETTLRKVGFDPETITSEASLADKLLAFNPDYVIAKGNTPRVSTLSIGKKLKESTKYTGKVILIFPKDMQPASDELIKLRMDIVLQDPMSALRLVTHLLSLTSMDKDAIMDKLLRFAHTDPQFRTTEQQILKLSGSTIDSEIQVVTSDKSEQQESMIIDEKAVMSFVQPGLTEAEPVQELPALAAESPEDKLVKNGFAISAEELPAEEEYVVSEEFKNQLKDQLEAAEQELPLRIDSYNRSISEVDQDLKKGLSKRQTKVINKSIFENISSDDLNKLDEERKDFVKALMKK